MAAILPATCSNVAGYMEPYSRLDSPPYGRLYRAISPLYRRLYIAAISPLYRRYIAQVAGYYSRLYGSCGAMSLATRRYIAIAGDMEPYVFGPGCMAPYEPYLARMEPYGAIKRISPAD